MTAPVRFFIFIAANIVGFFSASFCYHLAVYAGSLPVTDPNFNPGMIKPAFSQIMLTWTVCGVFSIAGLFLREKIALLFLIAPGIVPLGYGLSLLVF